MKKISFVALVLAFTCLSTTVYAAPASTNSNSWYYTDGYSFELTDDTIEVSKDAMKEFEAFLDTLDMEARQLILEDGEMVYMMLQDNYWKEPDQNAVAYSVSLPLDEYGDGTYYTINKRECSCHDKCSYVIPSGSALTDRCYVSKTGSWGNCRRYNSSIQCKAFADYVFHEYTGADVSGSNIVKNLPGYITNDAAGQKKLKDFLSTLTVGSNVRVKARNQGYSHSFIITDITDEGVEIYDCNGTSAKCKVRVAFKTWAQLATSYSDVAGAWKA